MSSSAKVASQGDVAIIRCSGPIILGATDELRNAAMTAIEASAKVILNLNAVTYVDSTGLGLLAHLCVSARRRGGDVKLVAPNALIREVLETTMLGHVFKIYATNEAALAAFA